MSISSDECVFVAQGANIEHVAEKALGDALATTGYGGAGNRLVYGNPRGRELLEDRNDLRDKMERIKDKMKGMEDEHRQDRQDIAGLRSRVKDLSLASEGYQKIRNRFLDVYRRDVLENIDNQGHSNIMKGNEAAHHGDAVIDAALYASNERQDQTLLVEIYGLSFAEISFLAQIGDYKSIATLDAGATWKANQLTRNLPPDVAAAFTAFTKELRENLGKDPTDGKSPLSKAYYAFWAAHKEEQRLRQKMV